MNQIRMLEMYLRYKLREFLKDEEGDTNFISILVILGIGMALAAVFFTYQKQITSWVSEAMGTFFDADKSPVVNGGGAPSGGETA